MRMLSAIANNALPPQALSCKPLDCLTTAGVTFQSRLGANKFNEWLKPYTDKTLRAMPGEGIKHLAVLCPAILLYLETLEEIGGR